jgi:hypothetical protein
MPRSQVPADSRAPLLHAVSAVQFGVVGFDRGDAAFLRRRLRIAAGCFMEVAAD